VASERPQSCLGWTISLSLPPSLPSSIPPSHTPPHTGRKNHERLNCTEIFQMEKHVSANRGLEPVELKVHGRPGGGRSRYFSSGVPRGSRCQDFSWQLSRALLTVKWTSASPPSQAVGVLEAMFKTWTKDSTQHNRTNIFQWDVGKKT